MVYSGLNESEIFWVGQVRFFDEMGGQFDIKPDKKTGQVIKVEATRYCFE